MIVIDRASASKALREMAEQSRVALAAGRSVLIFPEGTRKPVAATVEFKRGVELLYRSLGVPVLPVVVNSGRFWGIGSAPRNGTIIVSFLAPIDPGLSAANFASSTEALMQAEKRALEREGIPNIVAPQILESMIRCAGRGPDAAGASEAHRRVDALGQSRVHGLLRSLDKPWR